MVYPPLPIDLDDPANAAFKNPAPKVKLPDVIVRKSAVPGSNSWAKSNSKETQEAPPKDTVETRPTNRDKYEDTSSPKHSLEILEEALPQSRTYIQPAVPLVNTSTQGRKHRVVTDPVQIRSLLASRKPSVSQLKKKGKIFEFSTSKLDLTDGADLPHPNVAPKALTLLGVQQESTSTLHPSPSQSQNLKGVHQHANKGILSLPSYSSPPQRNAVPTQRSPSEDKNDTSISRASKSPKQHNLKVKPCEQSLGAVDGESEDLHHEPRNGYLYPPKIPVYGNVGKQHNIVESQGLHPSNSFHGVIENASPIHLEKDAERQQQMTPTKGVQRDSSGEILRPTVYASMDYSSAWENEPDMNYVLPPFTPMPENGHPNHEHVPRGLMVGASDVFRDASDKEMLRKASTTYGFEDHHVQETTTAKVSQTNFENVLDQSQSIRAFQPGSGLMGVAAQNEQSQRSQSRAGIRGNGANGPQEYATQYAQHGLRQAIFDSRPQSAFDQPPLATANSWATFQGNYPSSSHTPVSAFLPPGWPAHLSHNAVPSPPHSQQDYQRPSQLSAGLAQLDLTLHHHIDSVFGYLRRQIADKHDHILDRVLLRIDNFEDNIFKELKGLKTDLNSVKKEVSRLRVSVAENMRTQDAISKDLRVLDDQISGLEKLNTQMREKDHIKFVDQSNSGNHPRNQSKHRRAESAHGSLGSPQAYFDEHMPSSQQVSTAILAANRSTSKTRQTSNSNGDRMEGVRSRAGFRSSQSGNQVKAASADLLFGTMNKTVPDLKDHPAYMQQSDQSGMRDAMMVMQGISDGLVEGDWYHQAYGKGT